MSIYLWVGAAVILLALGLIIRYSDNRVLDCLCLFFEVLGYFGG